MPSQLPPLNALLAFEAAARLGRMTAAAQELCVTPGAVSKQVHNLETWLGVQLFEGTKNNPVLSATGRLLQPQLSAAFEQLRHAVRTASAAQAHMLSVGCYNTLAAKWLLPRLPQWAAHHSATEVQLCANTDIDLQRGHHLDVTLLAQREDAALAAGLQRTVLWTETLVPVLSAPLQHSLRIRNSLQLTQATLLHTQSRPDAWAVWAAAQGVRLATQPKATAYQHYYFTIEAALRGLGVCIAPWHLVMDDVAAGRLVTPLPGVATGLRYVALYAAQPKPAVVQFCQWLGTQAVHI
jgi:LysR family transcriptional regulator, glycine cleavage system transcriptional activator